MRQCIHPGTTFHQLSRVLTSMMTKTLCLGEAILLFCSFRSPKKDFAALRGNHQTANPASLRGRELPLPLVKVSS